MIAYSESPGWSLLLIKQMITSQSYHQIHPIMSLNMREFVHICFVFLQVYVVSQEKGMT